MNYDRAWLLQTFDFTDEQIARLNAAWDEAKHPRHGKGKREGGRFAPKHGVARGAEVDVSPAEKGERAFLGKPVDLTKKLSKHEIGALSEAVAVGWLKAKGFGDAAPLDFGRNNFPLDLIDDHKVFEVKGGLVSNRMDAQKWRLTIGEPGQKEKAWLAKATEKQKAAFNERKMDAIFQRKMEAFKEVKRRYGRPIHGGETLTVLIDTDRGLADIYRFKGFHSSIRWRSEMAESGYQGTVRLSNIKTHSVPDEHDYADATEDEAIAEYESELDDEADRWIDAVLDHFEEYDAEHGYAFDPAKHKRHPKGVKEGGRFAPKHGTGEPVDDRTATQDDIDALTYADIEDLIRREEILRRFHSSAAPMILLLPNGRRLFVKSGSKDGIDSLEREQLALDIGRAMGLPYPASAILREAGSDSPDKAYFVMGAFSQDWRPLLGADAALRRSIPMESVARARAMDLIIHAADRHAENYMVNVKTKDILPIDFGHSFGEGIKYFGDSELVKEVPAVRYLASAPALVSQVNDVVKNVKDRVRLTATQSKYAGEKRVKEIETMINEYIPALQDQPDRWIKYPQ